MQSDECCDRHTLNVQIWKLFDAFLAGEHRHKHKLYVKFLPAYVKMKVLFSANLGQGSLLEAVGNKKIFT